ncbi:hypothetical protein HX747_16555 [Streptomyces sp. L06]|nr:hypothetical protein [Streptomyces sp. L06]
MSTAHTEGTATVAGTTEAPAMDAPTARPTPSLADGRRRPPSRPRQVPEASTGDRQAAPAAALPLWLRWTTVAALLLCGVTHFPFQRTGLPASAYGLAVGIAVLCLLLAASTLLRRVLPVLIADILLMGSLTAAHLLAPATGPRPSPPPWNPAARRPYCPRRWRGSSPCWPSRCSSPGAARARAEQQSRPPAPGTSAPTPTGGDPPAHPPSTRQAQVGAVPTWACP